MGDPSPFFKHPWMKTKLTVGIAIVSLTFFYSCGSSAGGDFSVIFPAENAARFSEDYQFVEDSVLSFPIDSATEHFHDSEELLTLDGKTYLTFLNKYNTTLYIYDLHSSQLSRKIKYKVNGPNGIGDPEHIGHVMRNFDTVYLVDNFKGQLYCTTSDGVIFKKIDLTAKYPRRLANPIISTELAPSIWNDHVYISGQGISYAPDDTLVRNLYQLDLHSDNVLMQINRPAFYNQAYWGNYYMYQFAFCIDQRNNRLVYGFAADPHTYSLDLVSGHRDSAFIGSRYFDHIPAMNSSRRHKADKHAVMEYGLTTPCLLEMRYDPTTRLYYRLVIAKPFSKEEYNDPNRAKKYPKQFSVIIFDSTFKKLGETLLPKGKYMMDTFLSSGGCLYFPLMKQKNEDQLQFQRLKLIHVK